MTRIPPLSSPAGRARSPSPNSYRRWRLSSMLATANYPYLLPGPPTHGQTTKEGREQLATDLFHRRELPVHFRLILLSQLQYKSWAIAKPSLLTKEGQRESTSSIDPDGTTKVFGYLQLSSRDRDKAWINCRWNNIFCPIRWCSLNTPRKGRK